MHFQIFIPKAIGADPKHLVPVGLGDLLINDPGPQMGEILDGGPDKGPGLLFVWKGMEPAYRPGELTWCAAKPDPRNRLPGGRFWWGFSPQDPPSAVDLARPDQLRGKHTSIDDQTWLIPNILMLPHKFILDDEGHEAREVSSDHRQMYNRGMWAYELLKAHIEGVAPAPGPELRRYVVDMLAVNYRIFRDLAAHLRLLGDENWFALACATVDIETLIKIEDDVAKKKQAAAEALITQLSLPPGDGPKA